MVIGFCELVIIYIDGFVGVLLYCGFLIEELVCDVDYFEVCYMFLYGDVLLKEEYEEFKDIIICYIMVYE